MSLDDLIRSVVKCCICDGPYGCACWIKLRCRSCKATCSIARDPADGDATEVETTCPDCLKGAIGKESS